jgi:hypothetical protein
LEIISNLRRFRGGLHKWLSTRGTERRLSNFTLDDLCKEDRRIILLTLIAAHPELAYRDNIGN